MRLIRTRSTETYTMGYFELSGDRRIYSLERPWVACTRGSASNLLQGIPPCGVKGVSCVPPGRYLLEMHESEDHPGTLALMNPELWVYHQEFFVPKPQRGIARTAVLIHPANWPEQLRGCIAPGLIPGKGYVENSRTATALLYKELKAGDTLEIVYDPAQLV